MDTNRFIELLEAYLQNKADEEEQQELFLMIASGKYDAQIQSRIDAAFDEEVLAGMDPAKAKEILEYIIANQPAKLIPLRRRTIWRNIAAASIILIVSIGVLLFVINNKKPVPGPPIAQETHDVSAPANTRAVITLANGQKVYLDSVSNGTIAQENNVNIVRNKEGEILYLSPTAGANSEQRTANSPTYNTLFNPRGSKVISLTLSDGTKVWLNSESSLKYPIAFNDKTREVQITGEAYFEVKHNAIQPFKVHLPNGSVVEDIGTSFNINAYNDEDNIKTTLIEGSVRVVANSGQRTANSQIVLRPGEQAIVSNPANPLIRKILVQTEEVIAWKENKFYFNSADIKTIMRQMARWYDVDVVYQDNITNHFTGIISRDVNASAVFKMLEQTGGVHLVVEGKKIVVKK